jgi:hypothetical protein
MPKKNTNSGNESIAPPAPVTASTKPTNKPNAILMIIGSIIQTLNHSNALLINVCKRKKTSAKDATLIFLSLYF